jgi:hypothetical protein
VWDLLYASYLILWYHSNYRVWSIHSPIAWDRTWWERDSDQSWSFSAHSQIQLNKLWMMHSTSDRDERLYIEDGFDGIIVLTFWTDARSVHDQSPIVSPEIPPIGPGRDFFGKKGISRKYNGASDKSIQQCLRSLHSHIGVMPRERNLWARQ